MSTRFFTNQADQTLLKRFRGAFESNADIEWFDALVGYLRASGYFAIRPFLNTVPHKAVDLLGEILDKALIASDSAPVFQRNFQEILRPGTSFGPYFSRGLRTWLIFLRVPTVTWASGTVAGGVSFSALSNCS